MDDLSAAEFLSVLNHALLLIINHTHLHAGPGVQISLPSQQILIIMATLDTTTKRKNAAAKESSLEHRHRAQSLIDSKALDELETEVFETGLYENQNLSIGSRYGVMAAEVIYSERQ